MEAGISTLLPDRMLILGNSSKPQIRLSVCKINFFNQYLHMAGTFCLKFGKDHGYSLKQDLV